MKTLRIAGVSVNADTLDTLEYEAFLQMALNSPKYYLKPNAKELIHKELKEHGLFKNTINKDRINKRRRVSRKRDNKKKG